MRLIGIRRDPRASAGHADAVHAMSELKTLRLRRPDLSADAGNREVDRCPCAGPHEADAYLINAARGRVVDDPALVDALARRQIRNAALDVTIEEPLPATSPLWAME